MGKTRTKRLCLRDRGETVMQEFEIEDLRAWSRGKLQLPPDFVIGDNYLRRWWIVPRNPFANVYLHEILHSDDDRAMHDHPWDNRTFVLEGGYIEHTPEGVFERNAGDVIARKASDAHRLEIPEGGRAVSIFMTGPVMREWGFHCPQGWRHWREFVDARDTGQIGKGCA